MTAPQSRLGRPLDHSIDRAVVDTVLLQLKRSGYRSITMEGIARRIGRARASLYRRWPSKRHLVAFAVVTELGPNPSPDTGSLRIDLMGAVETLVTGFQGALGPALAGLVGEMAGDPVLARTIRKEVLAKRRRSIRSRISARNGAWRNQAGRQYRSAHGHAHGALLFPHLIWARQAFAGDDRNGGRHRASRRRCRAPVRIRRLRTAASRLGLAAARSQFRS